MRIKKYLLCAATIAGLSMMQSCSLEIDPTGQYSEATAYASTKNLDMYVKNFYGIFYANADINVSSNCLMDDGISDLVKYSWYGVAAGAVNRFFYEQNYVTAESNFRSNWSDMYTRIRALNDFFYDVNHGYASKIDGETLKVRLAEVRFMRAFAYQELTLRHGGVILRINETSVDGPNERTKARSTEEECWDFIINEYDKAAEDLPAAWENSEAGRLTKGAAYGMKARAALYAKRWQDAIDACNELFDLGLYNLMPGKTAEDYYKIFTSVNNSELILPVYFQQGTGMKQHNFNQYFCPPYDFQQGNSVGAAATPSDEYASAFDIKSSGKYQAFDWSKVSDYGNEPFQNREPRFYASILYNDETWRGRKLQLYTGGTDGYLDFKITGQDNNHKTTTGYIFRKFMSDDANMNYTSLLSGQYWIEMRLAEIYLIRSEAYARLGLYENAYSDINVIRNRVGLDALTQQNNWEKYLTDLSKERICELGLEGHRYFDLVRWGKAVSVLNNSRLHGVKITKKPDNTFSYERVECDTQNRLFPERYTIFPIPYTELQTNTLCKQQEIWQ